MVSRLPAWNTRSESPIDNAGDQVSRQHEHQAGGHLPPIPEAGGTMRRKGSLAWMVTAFLGLLLFSGCVDPMNIHVDASAVAPGNGSSTFPFRTIEDGLTAAAPGGTVHVAAGDYPENLIVGKSVILGGAGAGETRLWADMAERGIEVVSDQVEIHGLSIIGVGVPGSGTEFVAGVWGENVSGLTLRNMVIGPYLGMGIAVAYSNGVRIEGNSVGNVMDQPGYAYDADCLDPLVCDS